MDLKRNNTDEYDRVFSVTRTIEVTPSNFLFLGKDGSKILRLDIKDHHGIKHTDHQLVFDVDVAFTPKYVARCILAKNSKTIVWDTWGQNCPQWMLNKVIAMYTNQEMVEYINSITDIRE